MFISIAPSNPVNNAVTVVAVMRQLAARTSVRLCDSNIVSPSV